MQDGKLVYHYNLAGIERYEIAGDLPTDLPTDKPVTLKAVYLTDADEPGAGARVTLYGNDIEIGEGLVCQTLANRITLDETFDVGFDTGTPVREDYADEMPFDFTGTLNKVTVELTDELAPEPIECPEPY